MQPGLFKMDGLIPFYFEYFPYNSFESLEIKLHISATDIIQGKTVYFSKGEIILPLIASTSVPVIFKPIQYKSADGLTIHGYLTLPKNKIAQNLPVIVNPHGGPWVRDTWRFNPEVQFLANRGFALRVVTPPARPAWRSPPRSV